MRGGAARSEATCRSTVSRRSFIEDRAWDRIAAIRSCWSAEARALSVRRISASSIQPAMDSSAMEVREACSWASRSVSAAIAAISVS
jgi:hypothetical protein